MVNLNKERSDSILWNDMHYSHLTHGSLSWYVFCLSFLAALRHKEFPASNQNGAAAAAAAASPDPEPAMPGWGSNLSPGPPEMPPIPLCQSGNSYHGVLFIEIIRCIIKRREISVELPLFQN